eukprot:6242675-Prymnesium_polylepis.1
MPARIGARLQGSGRPRSRTAAHPGRVPARAPSANRHAWRVLTAYEDAAHGHGTRARRANDASG